MPYTAKDYGKRVFNSWVNEHAFMVDYGLWKAAETRIS